MTVSTSDNPYETETAALWIRSAGTGFVAASQRRIRAAAIGGSGKGINKTK
ncbi:hypothetical protein CASFOL_028982 [Castilleja foliolosa]|uniref:Uncharacterized protein n=1 Tax=Castilleja foliolosa TaxID=1961234 RepID=A0ABD3CE95_9LAMI